MEPVRLNKYLAQCGICSRREADQRILAGRVLLDGRTAQPGDRVTDGSRILVDGKPVKVQEKAVLAYYKPVGVTCTERDPFAERKITDELRYKTRVTYAGRLDKDSEGLMLMTNDGALIDAMMRGSNRHEKEYIVKLKREYSGNFTEKMAAGVYLPELGQTTRPCRAEPLGKYTIRLVLTQGLNRQIRRMCKALDNEVVSLKRVRIMNVRLAGLAPGEYRELSETEKKALYQDCGLREQKTESQRPGADGCD